MRSRAKLGIAVAIICVGNFSDAKIFSYVKDNDPRFDARGNLIANLFTDPSLTVHTFRKHGARANLVDRNGIVIATDVMQKRLAIWPRAAAPDELKKTFADDVKTVSNLLGREICPPLTPNLADRANTPVVFPQVLTEKEISILEANRTTRIGLFDVPVRTYPYGQALTHAVGWATQTLTAGRDTFYNPSVGQSALETLLEPKLAARTNEYSTIHDANNYTLKTIDEEPAPNAGPNVVVTIDAELQKRLDTELKKQIRQGVVLVADYSTGALRVMLSYPSFNPNQVSPYLLEPIFKDLKSAPGMPYVNRIFRKYDVAEHLADKCDSEQCTPMQMLAHFQRKHSGPDIKYVDDKDDFVLSTSSTNFMPDDEFNSKVIRWDGKSNGQLTITPMINGKFHVLILIEGDGVENQMTAARKVLATKLADVP